MIILNNESIIRKAKEIDSKKIIDIIQSSLSKDKLNKMTYGTEKASIYLNTLIACKLNTEYIMFVYETKDEVIGYIEYRILENKAHINYIFIDANYTKQKVGTELLIQTIKLLPSNIKYIELNVFEDNNIALKWYQKIGFEKTNEIIIIEKHIPQNYSQPKENQPIILNYPQYINNYNSYGFSEMKIKINSEIFNIDFLGKEYFRVLDINLLKNEKYLNSLKSIDNNRKIFSILPKEIGKEFVENYKFIETNSIVKMEIHINKLLEKERE